MASRPVVPQQGRGEAVVVGVNKNQKNNEAAAVAVPAVDGRNRRALGDIGNLVTVRGVDDKPPSRPITRSFCAQLLANAQAAAAAEKNKKKVCTNMGAKRVVPKPNQVKKNTAKPKPDTIEVIEISHGTIKKVKDQEVSARKKTKRTFTSILTARSKAVRSKDIVDIDVADASNELASIEYVEDMYKFFKEIEIRPQDYMNSQPDINEKMRAIIVDWLIDVHQKFELSQETFYLTINIIDRFLSVKIVPRRELQLLGISATLIASKYEEIWAPEANDLVCISDRAYTHQQILLMEKAVLEKLEWNLTVPTHYVFLARFLKASIPDKDMENMVYFLAELGMTNYQTVMHVPSLVAASAVYAARCTLNKAPLWTETLKLHTGYSEQRHKDCAVKLVHLHTMVPQDKLQTVYKRYSKDERGGVALIPPAKALL